MQIKEIMETKPYAIHCDATVKEVMKKLSDARIGGMPVTNDAGRVVGYIGNKDIMRFLAHRKAHAFDLGGAEAAVEIDDESLAEKVRTLLKTPLSEIIPKHFITLNEHDSVREASDVFLREGVRKIAVVNDDGLLTGVIQRSTIIHFIFQKYLRDEK
jgi:predicted transcriptional regulator